MTAPGVYSPQQVRSGMADDRLVEAVARAIAGANGDNPDAPLNDMFEGFVATWTLYEDDALAAIAAVRQHMADDGK